ncbi:MAG: tRNA 2-thiocytidine(32) synthetase TtcA, partial [Nitrospirota bacterium]|nr:tRNA 2-thiocytidine(32) synthetase TtcA [Nitrospirota bacterium]
AYVKEVELASYAELRQFPIIPCDLCGSQENLQRKAIKHLLQEWEQRTPGCRDSMFAGLSNVAPSLLMDRTLFDFASLRAIGTEEVTDDHVADDGADEGEGIL